MTYLTKSLIALIIAGATEVEEKLPETGGMHLYMVGIALALLVAGSLLLASSKIRAAHKVVA
ncbi:MAG: LPXTG cell wall anchor domain-containing protein [Acidimicrobiales bacterium]|nr:LPXTG cell wall anchor domain-containing protein [Acidimicrobiales bacterium]